ncbi:MAG TPA: M23 family metallopeptidase, partial [Chthonomonadaceae bacterium]|nr:M23 family metallopeptidase [Chthonomonadaceae bacterium]
KWINDCNYVVVKHEDGTFAEYLHLKKDGVLVHLGDRVTPDQPIALSGNSGYSTEPHLHVSVFSVVDGYMRKSLPLTFALRGGVTFQPQEGRVY